MKRTRMAIAILGILIMTAYGTSYAFDEPIPHKVFVKITDEYLAAVEEYGDLMMDAKAPKEELKRALAKYFTALSKYDAYVDKWPKDSKQYEVVSKIKNVFVEIEIAASVRGQKSLAKAYREADAAYREYKKAYNLE